MKIFKIINIVFFCLSFTFCFSQKSSEEEKTIFLGQTVKDSDLVMLFGLIQVNKSLNNPCNGATIYTESSKISEVTFNGENKLVVCSYNYNALKINVSKSGTYKVSIFNGNQTLSSSRCNSSNFTLYAYFKSGSVTGDKVSSYSDKIQNSISLDSSKTYYFLQSGSVNSNHYSCGYSSVESSITTPYRIEIEP